MGITRGVALSLFRETGYAARRWAEKHYSAEDLPVERTLRDILNRRNCRLKPMVQLAEWPGLEVRLIYYPLAAGWHADYTGAEGERNCPRQQRSRQRQP